MTKAFGDIGISVDGLGNIYLSGIFTGIQDFDPGPGIDTHSGNGVFITKINADDTYEWTKTMDGVNLLSISSPVIAANGDIYIKGMFSGTIDFDSGPGENIHTANGATQAFIAKLNSDGSYGWATPLHEASSTGSAIAVDLFGNAYITGYFANTIDFDPSAGEDIQTATKTTDSFMFVRGDVDGFLTRINADGSYGWTAIIGGQNEDAGYSVAVDSNGNIYVTGILQYRLLGVSAGPSTGTLATSMLFLAKFATTLPDTTPDPFSFAPLTGVAPGSVVTSNAITISGINAPAPISIAGGEYSIDGGAFTSAAGTVSNGQTVAVHLTAASTAGTTITATLTIGGENAPFNVTTRNQATADLVVSSALGTTFPMGGLWRVTGSMGVTNNGPDTATGVKVLIHTEPGLGLESGYSWDIGTLPAGASVSHSMYGWISTSNGYWDTTVTHDGIDPVPANNTIHRELSAPVSSALFSFIPQTGISPGSIIVSNPIMPTGVNYPWSISITGGEYSINGGAFTSAVGTVSMGETVTVRLTAANAPNVTTIATLTIGGVSGTFSVTTADVPPDSTPDSFSFFSPQARVTPGSEYRSNEITVTGINTQAPISIVGGEYSINGGPFTNTAGIVSNGQRVTVRLIASSNPSVTISTTLTIGGVSASFRVTTEGIDSSPDPFNIIPGEIIGINPGTVFISQPITVTGIDTRTPISISGGMYSVNGDSFTSAAVTLYGYNGQTVRVMITAASSPNVTTTATLTIGGVSGTISVTTAEPPDTTPDPFSFTPKTGVVPGSVVTSNTITISGINAPASISIAGGEYSIDGGVFTSAAGTVNNGQTVTVRLTAADTSATTTTATLTIGGENGPFNVTTRNQATADLALGGGVGTTAPLGNMWRVTGSMYIKNNGPDTATGVKVLISSNVGVDTTTVPLVRTAEGLVWNIGTLQPGAEAGLNVGGWLSAANGYWDATVTHDGADPNSANDTIHSVMNPPDLIPDPFSFAPQTGVAPGTVAISNPITVTGITGAAQIIINGGEYSIDGGAFTSAMGTVNNGQTVRVRVTASNNFGTTTQAILFIGLGTTAGGNATFSVTTALDTTTATTTTTTTTTNSTSTTSTTRPTTTTTIRPPSVMFQLYGWTDPRKQHRSYVERNGVGRCVSCHSVTRGVPSNNPAAPSCFTCHGQKWSTPTTTTAPGATTTTRPPSVMFQLYGWTKSREQHRDYVERKGVAECIGCHSVTKGVPSNNPAAPSCFTCHGQKWRTPTTTTAPGATTTTRPPSVMFQLYGWTDPRKQHRDYVRQNGITQCISCHRATRGVPSANPAASSCFTCHGQKWRN